MAAQTAGEACHRRLGALSSGQRARAVLAVQDLRATRLLSCRG